MERNLDQNAKFHAALEDISKQLKWAGQSWSKDDWKFLLLGAKYGQTVGPNPFAHGLIVMNKKRSSKLSKVEMSELISEVIAFGDTEGVVWTDPMLTWTEP